MTKSVLNVVVLILCFVGGFTVQSSVAKQAPSELTFKTAAREVSVPVVVLDSKGRAVGNLTRSSFEIFDNGKRQALSGFETQVAPGVTQGHSVTRTDQTGGTGQQSPALSEVMNQPARYIAILFDDIHSESGDLVRVRKSVSRVLTSSLTNADAAAILSTSGRVDTGFTHDLGKLQAAISDFGGLPRPSRAGGDCPDIDHYEAYMIIYHHDPQALEVVAEGGERCPPPTPTKEMNEGIARAAAEWELPIGEQRTRNTLEVIRELSRQMGKLPGQRIIVLISPGFIALTPAAEQAKSRAIDLAAQFNVTIGCLDIRGLDTQMEDESKLLDSLVLDQFVSHSRIAHGDSLAQLAAGTGGRYFRNSNDFDGGLKSLIAPPQYRYVMRFSANATKQDGTFHKIKVKVKDKHVTVHARAGYFAERTYDRDR